MSWWCRELRPTKCWDLFGSLGHPYKFQRVFASWQRYCTASSSERQPNFAALNWGRHLCSAGRSSGWALAHILVIIILGAHHHQQKAAGLKIKLSEIKVVATIAYSVIIVLWKETAFLLWRAMDKRWKRNDVLVPCLTGRQTRLQQICRLLAAAPTSVSRFGSTLTVDFSPRLNENEVGVTEFWCRSQGHYGGGTCGRKRAGTDVTFLGCQACMPIRSFCEIP